MDTNIKVCIYMLYTYNDTSFELSVFWPSDTESRISELRFETVLLSTYNIRFWLGN